MHGTFRERPHGVQGSEATMRSMDSLAGRTAQFDRDLAHVPREKPGQESNNAIQEGFGNT